MGLDKSQRIIHYVNVISTVTTTTTTTVTTASIAIVAALGIAAVITLIGFLVMRELATASDGPRFKMLGRHLSVGIVPLLMVFGMIAAMKVMEVLS
jgi:hypothetical protein